jgi:hypothetical protein
MGAIISNEIESPAALYHEADGKPLLTVFPPVAAFALTIRANELAVYAFTEHGNLPTPLS